jgi:hypothetical protein
MEISMRRMIRTSVLVVLAAMTIGVALHADELYGAGVTIAKATPIRTCAAPEVCRQDMRG